MQISNKAVTTMEKLPGGNHEILMSDHARIVTEVVSTNDLDKLERCLNHMHQTLNWTDVHHCPIVVGFDTDCSVSSSSPRHGINPRITLLKLCTESCCILISLDQPIYIPNLLVQFLTNKDITFAGVHVKEDLVKLQNDYGLHVKNAVELSELAKEMHYLPASMFGLRYVASKVANLVLPSLSPAWSDRRDGVADDQIMCATAEAYAAYRIGMVLVHSLCSDLE